jgi:hypothetical protein
MMSIIHRFVRWHTHNLSGTLDCLAFLDQTIGTEKHDTDLSSFQVHAHSLDTGGEPKDAINSWVIAQLVVETYSTSSSAWTLFMPWTRAIPSLSWTQISHPLLAPKPQCMIVYSISPIVVDGTYPTERTRPVSARPDSSWTPRILCSRMDETSVGDAFASAA